ncbi:low affinity immunoglobulin epsilon Fc receptor-like [Armigeres subalbatus]|uniref:low affinity immunoglobulin epsilon Fc receptor-like n=1 Tax=Armigeres subalbatus TaxID=124917 RepID=UPI002ED4CC20
MRFSTVIFVLLPLTIEAKRFFIPNFKTNWHKAHEFCISLEMSLVSVESQNDHNELVKFTKRTDKFSNASRFWIGASDLAEEGVYTWVSSSRLVTFTNWAEGEPNNGNQSEHCIEMIHNTYVNRIWQWNDIDCRGFQAYFVCEDRTCISEF